MTQWIRALPAKPGHLSSVFKSYMVEDGNPFQQLVPDSVNKINVWKEGAKLKWYWTGKLKARDCWLRMKNELFKKKYA